MAQWVKELAVQLDYLNSTWDLYKKPGVVAHIWIPGTPEAGWEAETRESTGSAWTSQSRVHRGADKTETQTKKQTR